MYVNARVTANDNAKCYVVTDDGQIHQHVSGTGVLITTEGEPLPDRSFAFYRNVWEAARAVRRVVETGKL